MKKSIVLLLISSLLFSFNSFSQNHFLYKRQIKGVENTASTTWYEIKLPLEVIEKANANFSDMRILGIEDKDTLEAPYRVKQSLPQFKVEKTLFKVINTSKKDDTYFFTLEVPKNTKEIPLINRISLFFENQNFDWSVELEGSQNQEEWFELLNKYRVVSIKNQITDYSFSSLNFSESKYNYYRLKITDNNKNEPFSVSKAPKLERASLFLEKTEYGVLQEIKIISEKIEQDKKNKQTLIDIELSHAVPINYLFLTVSDDFDYYRPLKINYLLDSSETEKGILYNFVLIYNGTLSSLEARHGVSVFLTRTEVKSKKYQIVIENQDNQPLDIEKIEVKKFVQTIQTRISGGSSSRSYFLCYGNLNAKKPNYDISRFVNDIPENLELLELGEEKKILQEKEAAVKPLFENSLWLWLVMGAIILILAFFTFRMLKTS